ncbi:mesoderm induction early response protein 1 isoform X2 [Drosophila bipectinata]|uniref:mesoderm induction early response protein 1 isoform X2 n=1 Tax=Drosophila bipectinata TaxID=42026 RepID=UPI001C8ABE83|nr:mesoderm induction early response protein 1 isoform X2 [Drosophila bipectinata]
MMEFGKSEHSLHSNSASEASADSGSLLALTPAKRDRERRKSPATSSTDNTSISVQAPMSPSSSVADTTFEPTIDMMVNDFDDEATLNEEEALADMEAHSAEDEIATLREESEMPIEELLAKYGGMAPSPAVSSSNRSSSSRRARRATKRQYQELDMETAHTSPSTSSSASQLEKPMDSVDLTQHQPKEDALKEASLPETIEDSLEGPPSDSSQKPHRSHLLDLYPDESFSNLAPAGPLEEVERFTPMQTLFDEVEADEEEDSESDTEDKKIIMVGTDYQAEIPEGLSQYGDILPYENEDQLIWEPSQVSEREVEDYLAKIQDTRSFVASEDDTESATGDESAPISTANLSNPPAPPPVPSAPPKVQIAPAAGDVEQVVKDNEQALHLLVQCGYDFKEALRRKRMNVVPLSDTMSSWSEDECQKFEEGIQKYGKDFYQIRQNQKSERRDQSFALNDTIDHMDVFINEAGAGNGNGVVTGNGSCSPHSSNGHSNGEISIMEKDPTASPRKSSSKSYSIMTGGQAAGVVVAGSSRKRGTSSSIAQEDDENIEEEPSSVNV